MNGELLFVYGTLKRGGANHPFLAGQEFVGLARTAPGFTLYRLEGYPGMVKQPGAPGVSGEVWRVTPVCLAELDALEGIDEGLYTRDPIVLLPPFAESPVQSYLYARPVDGRQHLGSDW